MTFIYRWLSAMIFSLAMLAGAAFAQDAGLPDYSKWTSTATSAEQTLSEGRASDDALELLRETIADWREQFLAAQDVNAARIETLQNQIAALGEPPADGETEDPEIAERREELNATLTELRAPSLRAEEAYTRSNGLIAEIDRIIRERQTDELLELGPTPLNPAYWPTALEDVLMSFHRAGVEIKANASSPEYQAEARQNLPLILLLVVIGLMLVIKGESWSRAAVAYLRGKAPRGTGVFRFLVSLGQVILPLLGIYALVQAFEATGFMGARWLVLLDQVPLWATLLLGIHWLADESFHENDEIATLPLEASDRASARRIADLLAWTYVLKSVLDAVSQFDNYPTATSAVMDFPLLVISGVLLFRLGRVRNHAAMAGSQSAAVTDDAGVFRLRFARLMGRAAMIIGVIGPVMAAIGYARFGEALVYPFIASLAVVGVLLILQRFVNDLYELITGKRADEEDSLLPVLAGFGLTLVMLPFLALIWGARVADLTEIWAQFQEGFTFGETRISPTDFMVVVIVFVIGYTVTRLLQGAFRTSILPKTKIDQGGQNAIVSGMGYVGIFVAAIIAITAGGLDLSSLAIVAGALSVGIGFGLQNIVSNFVSGIILLIERPISEGDWIEVNGTHGIVKDISVRSTRMETFDKYDVIIPNADFVSGTVSNYTRGNSLGRIIVSVGVAYGNDTRKVEKILLDIARQHDMVLMNPEPFVFFKGFGADSLDFEIRCILRDVGKGLVVRTEMHHQIVERFTEEGIEIPFAQRDIWLRNPEALQPGAAHPPEAPKEETSPAAKSEADVSNSAAGIEPDAGDR
ncbi:DUF3772 domain-containing protein [Tropicibacter naphthalenivorans]|uniref:Putative MscS family protein.1 n=1 Tax=Tropicibacter naphthalenivorans TaxID=441103 RepID=A0A0P1GRW1_9RHOB|nr:DUF3772 domain-containing protein [Tropicibacter naphthalenivorans]CUH76819.1 putative MscS family protein.1 precursor [Tropicibacter naphthalenivorans]SMC62794.1 Small-conductance mechanosensitive channel [Tropicibacter naphthalenivorans]